MDSKHTPGPWKLDPDDTGTVYTDGNDTREGVTIHTMPDGITAANHINEDDGYEEDLANARLIAAAPELLAVVEQLAWRYEGEQARSADPATWTIPHELGQAARAAIAKAEGRAGT